MRVWLVVGLRLVVGLWLVVGLVVGLVVRLGAELGLWGGAEALGLGLRRWAGVRGGRVVGVSGDVAVWMGGWWV